MNPHQMISNVARHLRALNISGPAAELEQALRMLSSRETVAIMDNVVCFPRRPRGVAMFRPLRSGEWIEDEA